jgi:hypothetical protein
LEDGTVCDGERINFVPPLNAPIAEIDELERMGARKTLP